MTYLPRDLKNDWMKMSEDYFEFLAFGELEVGDKFIGIPEPGDNSGHGGLRGTHYLFIKTDEKVTQIGEVPYAKPHTIAVKLKDGAISHFGDDIIVIKVE